MLEHRVTWQINGRWFRQTLQYTDGGIVPAGDVESGEGTPDSVNGKPVGCGNVESQRWPTRFGPRWWGIPWPKRLRASASWPFVYLEDLPGCGCMVKLKAAYHALRMFWKA